MSDPKIFRSNLSAADIQSLIESIPQKVAKTDVKGTVPGSILPQHVASVQLMVEEIQKVVDVLEGADLRTLIEALTDCNVFTDSDHTKLDRISESFIGVFADEAQRDTEHPDDTNLLHNDVILVTSNPAGRPAIQFWNSGTQTWVDVYDPTGSATYNQVTAGAIDVATFLAANARGATYNISVTSGSSTHIHEVGIVHDGVGNVYANTRLIVGAPSAALVTYNGDKSPGGETIRLTATTNQANNVIKVQRVALL